MRRFIASVLFAFAALPMAQAADAAFATDPARTLIEADVRATGHSFTVQVSGARVEITGDAGTGRIDGARISIRWDQLTTGNKDRDHAMREWADAASHPAIVFTLVSIAQGPEGPVATGSLAMNGVQREISFPVAIGGDGANALRISGRVTIDHREWNLPTIRRMLFLTVDPVLTIRFALAAWGT